MEIIDTELRSFLRNAFERILGVTIGTDNLNPWVKVCIGLSYRMVASLIAVYLFNKIQGFPNFNKIITYIFVSIFVGFLVYTIMKKNHDKKYKNDTKS